MTQLALEPIEQSFSDKLRSKFGSGERSCIAIAVHRQGLFVCDDTAARKEAQKHGVPVTGTIGILVLNVRQSNLAAAEANTLLTGMISRGYRSPIARLDDLL